MGKISLDPYLFFRGDAKEAMGFYKSVFGGDLKLQTVGEAQDFPGKEKMNQDYIMHALLDGDVRLMASDTENASPEAKKIELSLSGPDEAKLRGYWDKLSEGGKVTAPLEKAPWGDIFGMLKDKYNIDWMVNITQAKL